jgi:uncharacterized protein (TIGR00730 family)
MLEQPLLRWSRENRKRNNPKLRKVTCLCYPQGMTKKSICVFCGAKPGNNLKYAALANTFGKALAKSGHRLVYGGGKVGLMGAVAEGALALGGDVLGIMPQALLDRELGHTGLTQLEIVNSMSVRKDRMIAASDAFIALPGGLGTLDELFEVMTLRQIGYHSKPVVVLNQDGYFTPLLEACRQMLEAEFVYPSELEYLLVADDVDGAIEAINGAFAI